MSRATLAVLSAVAALLPSSLGWAQPAPPCSQTSGVPCTIGGTVLVTSIDASHGGGGGGGGGGATVTIINDPLNPGVTITGNSPITGGPGATGTGSLSFSLQTISGLPAITDLSASINATFTGDATGTVTSTTPVGDLVLGRLTPGGPDTLTGEVTFPGVSSLSSELTLSANGGTNGTASLLGLTFQVSLSPSVKAATKCRGAIVSAAAKFVQAKAKALQKCEEAKVKGTLAPNTVCKDEPVKTVPAITKASTKLSSTIAKACGGQDKVCGLHVPDSDDIDLDLIGWHIDCPNFENGSCTNPINTCGDIHTCIECISEAAVDQAIGLYYGTLNPTNAKSKDKTEKALNKCQATIGKTAAGFLAAKSKALAKCWGAVNKAGAGTCPDTTAAAAIAAASSKKDAAIKKACLRPDKAPFTPADIGFPATCMDVTPPGGSSCGGVVNGSSLQDLIDCVDCVTEFKVDCADRAAVPAFVAPYPAECNLGTPVATPTVIATPTPTVTATP